MTAIVLLETPRLILRTVTLADLDRVALTWNLDGPLLSRAEAHARISRMTAKHQQNARGRLVHLCLAIIHAHSGRLFSRYEFLIAGVSET